MPKISIIIPMYNSEEYISQCLDSVRGQTFYDLEIIVIDDGSTDSSYTICEAYQKKDNRIKLFRQSNQGNVMARKSGLMHATGEYITFVDSDDWVDEVYYELLIGAMQEEQADVIASGCTIEREAKSEIVLNRIPCGIYHKPDIEKQIYPHLFSEIEGTGYCNFGVLQYLWNKIYRRDLIIECFSRLDEKIYDGEDVACIFDILLHADTIIVDDHAMYHYRVHEGSICTTQKDERYFANTIYLYHYLHHLFCQQPKYKDILLDQLDKLIAMFMNNGMLSAFGIMYVPKYIWTLPNLPKEDRYTVAIWGAGKVGQSYYEQLSKRDYVEVTLWVDSAKAGEVISGKEIKEPQSVKNTQFDYIIIAIKDGGLEIVKQLCEMSVRKGCIIYENPQKIQCGMELKKIE